jgi:hypothetical protein
VEGPGERGRGFWGGGESNVAMEELSTSSADCGDRGWLSTAAGERMEEVKRAAGEVASTRNRGRSLSRSSTRGIGEGGAEWTGLRGVGSMAARMWRWSLRWLSPMLSSGSEVSLEGTRWMRVTMEARRGGPASTSSTSAKADGRGSVKGMEGSGEGPAREDGSEAGRDEARPVRCFSLVSKGRCGGSMTGGRDGME